jgi:hypothetical protein
MVQTCIPTVILLRKILKLLCIVIIEEGRELELGLGLGLGATNYYVQKEGGKDRREELIAGLE